MQPCSERSAKMRAEIIATGIPFPEGPIWTDDAQLVVTSIPRGELLAVDLFTGRSKTVADVAGGPNGAAPIEGGGFVVTQNGGIDYAAHGLIPPDLAPPFRPTRPGLQLVSATGKVSYLATDGLTGPSDVATGADGHIYFTDPGAFPPKQHDRNGRIMRYDRTDLDQPLQTIADNFWFCNGIAADQDGSLVVIELTGMAYSPDIMTTAKSCRCGLVRVWPDGSRATILEDIGGDWSGADGLCLDSAGRMYVTAFKHGVWIIDRDGSVLDLLEIPGDGFSTNCCFGGEDGRTLFVTDGYPGQIAAFEGMPTKGMPVNNWRAGNIYGEEHV